MGTALASFGSSLAQASTDGKRDKPAKGTIPGLSARAGQRAGKMRRRAGSCAGMTLPTDDQAGGAERPGMVPLVG